jgi:hypothetical protein
MVKVVGWYDNEIGYSSRIIDLILFWLMFFIFYNARYNFITCLVEFLIPSIVKFKFKSLFISGVYILK